MKRCQTPAATRRRLRSCWVRSWISRLCIEEHSNNLKAYDDNFCRRLWWVASFITHKDKNCRKASSSDEFIYFIDVNNYVIYPRDMNDHVTHILFCKSATCYVFHEQTCRRNRRQCGWCFRLLGNVLHAASSCNGNEYVACCCCCAAAVGMAPMTLMLGSKLANDVVSCNIIV